MQLICDTSKSARVQTLRVCVGTRVCKTICACTRVCSHACVAKQPPTPRKQHACDTKTTRV